MTRIAASLVFPVSSPPVKNAVVTIDQNGVVLSVEGDSARFRERAGVEFYSGILIPGMADVFCGERESSWLMTRGVRVAGRTGIPREISTLSGESQLAAGTNRPPGDSITLSGESQSPSQAIWKGWQGIVEYRFYNDIAQFQNSFPAGKTDGIYHARRTEGLPVLGSGGKMEMIDLLFRLQEGEAGAGLPLLITMATLNGARALGFQAAGCLLPGMQPGLNIIEGADIGNMRLLSGSRLRRLC
jgi:hypothetical protein